MILHINNTSADFVYTIGTTHNIWYRYGRHGFVRSYYLYHGSFMVQIDITNTPFNFHTFTYTRN